MAISPLSKSLLVTASREKPGIPGQPGIFEKITRFESLRSFKSLRPVIVPAPSSSFKTPLNNRNPRRQIGGKHAGQPVPRLTIPGQISSPSSAEDSRCYMPQSRRLFACEHLNSERQSSFSDRVTCGPCGCIFPEPCVPCLSGLTRLAGAVFPVRDRLRCRDCPRYPRASELSIWACA